jgi:RNA polymerase sigma factor (sigma-70 family)
MDDLRRVAAVKSGDTTQFGPLYDEYSDKIYKFIYYRTHHKQTAEDLTSTTFVKALERIRQYDESKGAFSTWLYQIARNAIIDHYRTQKPEQDIQTVWDLSDGTDIERDVQNLEQIKQVKEKLSMLTPEQRDIIIMRLWDDMPYAQIATVTGKSEGACKMAFSRGIKALRFSFLIVILFMITVI